MYVDTAVATVCFRFRKVSLLPLHHVTLTLI